MKPNTLVERNTASPSTSEKEITMKTFVNVAAQGEIKFFRRPVVGETKPMEPVNGNFIIGHDHVMDAAHVEVMERTEDVPEGLRILRLIVKEPTALTHLRPYDTHEPIMFAPGEYEVRLAREYTPAGLRATRD
jgi:hypothetical protein